MPFINKQKLIKWIQEEITGSEIRKETEREIAMRELLVKVERGYFDVQGDFDITDII